MQFMTVGKADLSMGYWNPEKKSLSEIIKARKYHLVMTFLFQYNQWMLLHSYTVRQYSAIGPISSCFK